MTEVMSASPAGGFHRSASSGNLSSASLLPRSASTGSLNSLKGSRTQLRTKIIPPSPPPSPKLSSVDSSFHFDVGDSFDAGLCLDDEIFLPIYDYDTSPPDELHSAALAVESVDVTKDASSVVETPELVVTAVDDNELKIEPSRHVDYLSHEWTEEEIASSWRYMVGKRNMYEYSARLENASWRTWAKSKFNLSTISPKKLNWWVSVWGSRFVLMVAGQKSAMSLGCMARYQEERKRCRAQSRRTAQRATAKPAPARPPTMPSPATPSSRFSRSAACRK